jgi:hypothetical protein
MSETILWVLIVVNAAGIAFSVRSSRNLIAAKRIYEELADECDRQLAMLVEANDRVEMMLRDDGRLFYNPWPDLPDWHDEDIKPSDDR